MTSFILGRAELGIDIEFSRHSATEEPTDLTAEVLAEASQALLVEPQQREDLEEPFYLSQVNGGHSFIQLL